MHGGKHVIAYFNGKKTARLSFDDLQWILERGRPEGGGGSAKGGGYRAVSFVCTRKDILLRCIRERGLEVDKDGRRILAALHADFPSFRRHIERSGIETVRAAIEDLAQTIVPIPRIYGLPRAVVLEHRCTLGLAPNFQLPALPHRGLAAPSPEDDDGETALKHPSAQADQIHAARQDIGAELPDDLHVGESETIAKQEALA
jgi:hypothetical protein